MNRDKKLSSSASVYSFSLYSTPSQLRWWRGSLAARGTHGRLQGAILSSLGSTVKQWFQTVFMPTALYRCDMHHFWPTFRRVNVPILNRLPPCPNLPLLFFFSYITHGLVLVIKQYHSAQLLHTMAETLFVVYTEDENEILNTTRIIITSKDMVLPLFTNNWIIGNNCYPKNRDWFLWGLPIISRLDK